MARTLALRLTRKDFRIDTFRSGGPGGQHQNKTDSGVRITHIDSGATGESRTDKSQHTNKKLAMERLKASPKFRMWIMRRLMELDAGKSVEQRVDEQMAEANIVTEVKDEQGRWQPTLVPLTV